MAAAGAGAQQAGSRDTVIRASTIEISQIYKPEVKQAVKQDYNPALPPRDQSAPSFNYAVPQQSLYYSYRSLPLRPLSLGLDSVTAPYGNYIKAGLGNLRTLYFDAGISALKGKHFESNIHAGFLSQKNGDFGYQKQTVAVLNGDAVYHTARYDWKLGADLMHMRFNQYGFDRVLYPGLVPASQTLSGGKVSLGLLPLQAMGGKWLFRPNVFASFYTGSKINNETGVGFDAPLTYTVDSAWSISAGLSGNTTKLQSEFYNINNNLLQLSLGMQYRKEALSIRAFLNPAIGQNSTLYILPDMEARYALPELQLHVGGGIKGSITQNTYSQLFLHNPYLSGFPSIQTHSNEVFGLVEKGIGNHITLSGRLSWWQYNYLPMYLNMALPKGEQMYVTYEPKVNAISIQGGLRYQIGTMLSVGANLLVYNYYKLSNSSRVWQTPANRLTGDLMWRPVEALTVTAYASFADQNYAVNAAGNEVKMKSYMDIGAGAEYEVLPRWSLFLNINNLLNSKYQRWYGYDAYGINIYGGLRFKF